MHFSTTQRFSRIILRDKELSQSAGNHIYFKITQTIFTMSKFWAAAGSDESSDESSSSDDSSSSGDSSVGGGKAGGGDNKWVMESDSGTYYVQLFAVVG